MDPALLLPIGGLALLDMLSPAVIGVSTYLLVTSGRAATARLLTYVGTVAVCYLAVGVVLLLGADAALAAVAGPVAGPAAWWTQGAVGSALFAGSWFVPTRPRDSPAARTPSTTAGLGAMVALGASTTLLEVATALPFFAAIGLLTTAGVPAALGTAVLAVYTALMVLPALVLLGVWRVAGERARPRMERLADWLRRQSGETLAWMIGIVGFLLAADAAQRLGLFS